MEKQIYMPRRKDPYRSQSKPRGQPECDACGAISLKGRWIPPSVLSKTKREDSGRHPAGQLCPACEQARDHYAGGVVELHGERWKPYEAEVMETVRNTESIARYRNDQRRVFDIAPSRDKENVTEIYVTLPQLAKDIGRVLQRSFKGKVQTHKTSEEPFVRIVWDSDAA